MSATNEWVVVNKPLVVQVESPSLVWVQLTSDPESDVAKLSQIITRLEPPRLTEVCV